MDGRIQEVPLSLGLSRAQRATELLESLRETLKERALGPNRESALRDAGSGYDEVKLAV